MADSKKMLYPAQETSEVQKRSPVIELVLAGQPKRSKKSKLSEVSPALVQATKIITNAKYSAAIVPPQKLEIFDAQSQGITLKDFISQNPDIMCAINGGFFDSVSGANGAGKIPTGLVISGGSWLWHSATDVSLGCDPSREQFMKKAAKESQWYNVFFIPLDRKGGFISSSAEFDDIFRGTDYADIYLALEAGPLLVTNGALASVQYNQRSSADSPLPRTAIGVNKDGDIIIFCTKEDMTYQEVAERMQKLGAVQAMGLDGGPSSGFSSPGRPDAATGWNETLLNTIFYAKP